MTDLIDEDGIPVAMPSGAVWQVLTDDEVGQVDNLVRRYTSDNHFTNVADLMDIDRVIQMEVLCHRWATYLSKGRDYFGEPIDEKDLRKTFTDISGEVRLLKKNVGIDKVGRDKAKGEGSVHEWLETVRVRAKHFGVMRNEQQAKTIELFQQLQALLVFHDNCDEIERREQHCSTDDLLQWIREHAIPEFNAIDEEFRNNPEHGQKMWIRDM